jgi:uncharacterized Zn finger protein
MVTATVSCVNCANYMSYNPDDLKNIDNPSVKCENCGEITPLTPDDLEKTGQS